MVASCKKNFQRDKSYLTVFKINSVVIVWYIYISTRYHKLQLYQVILFIKNKKLM